MDGKSHTYTTNHPTNQPSFKGQSNSLGMAAMKILVKGGEALFGIGRIESKKQLETTKEDGDPSRSVGWSGSI